MDVREAQAVNTLLWHLAQENGHEPDPDDVIEAATDLAAAAHRVLGTGLDGPAAALLAEQSLQPVEAAVSEPTIATEHGICVERGDEIEPGDEVYDYPGGAQIHVDCNPDE